MSHKSNIPRSHFSSNLSLQVGINLQILIHCFDAHTICHPKTSLFNHLQLQSLSSSQITPSLPLYKLSFKKKQKKKKKRIKQKTEKEEKV